MISSRVTVMGSSCSVQGTQGPSPGPPKWRTYNLNPRTAGSRPLDRIGSPLPPARAGRGEVTMSDYGLRTGTPDIKSSGPIAFGPEGILFLADNVAAKVFAVDVGDAGAEAGAEPFDLENVD